MAPLTPVSPEGTGLVDRLVALLHKLIGRNPPNSRTIGATLTGLDALVAELDRLRALRDGLSRFAQSRQSLFDFAHRMPGAARILLRQQYRSVGPIVDYISREFYGSELKTAYDPSKIRPPANVKPGLAWTHVPAPAVLDANNVNRAEVAAIAAHVETLLMHEG